MPETGWYPCHQLTREEKASQILTPLAFIRKPVEYFDLEGLNGHPHQCFYNITDLDLRCEFKFTIIPKVPALKHLFESSVVFQ